MWHSDKDMLCFLFVTRLSGFNRSGALRHEKVNVTALTRTTTPPGTRRSSYPVSCIQFSSFCFWDLQFSTWNVTQANLSTHLPPFPQTDCNDLATRREKERSQAVRDTMGVHGRYTYARLASLSAVEIRARSLQHASPFEPSLRFPQCSSTNSPARSDLHFLKQSVSNKEQSEHSQGNGLERMCM